jgi:hypothetical protein
VYVEGNDIWGNPTGNWVQTCSSSGAFSGSARWSIGSTGNSETHTESYGDGGCGFRDYFFTTGGCMELEEVTHTSAVAWTLTPANEAGLNYRSSVDAYDNTWPADYMARTSSTTQCPNPP